MKLVRSRSQLVLVLLIVPLSAAFLDGARAHAQKRTTHVGEGQERLLPPQSWAEEEKVFQNLRKGNEAITPDGEAIIDHGAQWYAYRLTFTEFQDGSSRSMHTLVKEGLEQILDPYSAKQPLGPQQKAFAEEFNKRLALKLQEVVKNPKPIARVNAAILLAQLAKVGQEDAADALADVILDPKENDGIKLWACRGLGDLFALTHGDNPIRFKNREGEQRWAQALLDYVTRKIDVPKNATPQEQAVIPWVRCEAIAALGQTRYPAVAEVANKKTIIKRPTSLALLRIIRKDGVTPPPTVDEQVAAVVALCRLRAKLCEDYCADYAAYEIGKFLVELSILYNNGTGNEKENWKPQAVHLMQALAELKADLQGPPLNDAQSYVAKLTQAAEPLLKEITRDTKGAPDPNSLKGWLEQNPPKHMSVYKSLPDSTINEPDKKSEQK